MTGGARERRDDAKAPKQDGPVGDIRLRATSGVVIDYTLPLHEAIDHQWRKGELSRVDEDGMPWEGDQYDVTGARSEPAGEDDGEPVRPGDNAPKTAWQEYAVAIKACDEDEAAGMTRAELIARCTPPELNPTSEA